nr:hypothetical protein [Tanacetum cinerariifolium]
MRVLLGTLKLQIQEKEGGGKQIGFFAQLRSSAARPVLARLLSLACLCRDGASGPKRLLWWVDLNSSCLSLEKTLGIGEGQVPLDMVLGIGFRLFLILLFLGRWASVACLLHLPAVFRTMKLVGVWACSVDFFILEVSFRGRSCVHGWHQLLSKLESGDRKRRIKKRRKPSPSTMSRGTCPSSIPSVFSRLKHEES